MEGIGDKHQGRGDDNDTDDHDERTPYAPFNVESAILRKSLWSAVAALETAFQLTPRPRLLATSAVSSPTDAAGVFEGGGGRAAGSSALMDFDQLLSTALIGGPASSSGGGGGGGVGSYADHVHLTMGTDAISMWNALHQRILMDCRVEFQHPNTSATAGGKQGAKEAENDHLAQICHEATEAAFSEADDSRLISLVLESRENKDDAVTGERPAKKTRRAGTKRSSSKAANKGGDHPHEEDYSQLSALLSSRTENCASFDCHVSVRRWAVLAFGWLCGGQKRLLETCAGMLTDGCEVWEGVMEMPTEGGAGSGFTTEAAVLSSMSTPLVKKKKKKDAKSVGNHPSQATGSSNLQFSEAVQGNLALIVFVCCVVDTLHDAGAQGGLSPPITGWMDEYVRAVAGVLPKMAQEWAVTELVLPTAAPAVPALAPAIAETAPSEGAGPIRRSSRKKTKATKVSRTEPKAKASPSAALVAATSSPPQRSHKGSPRGPGVGSRRGPLASPGGGSRTWARPDVRDEAAVLAKALVEAHATCLNDNFGGQALLRPLSGSGTDGGAALLLVNDDESFPGHSSGLHHRRHGGVGRARDASGVVIGYHYPFMHRTLETLGRAAASSSPSLVSSSSESCRSRVVAVASSVALGCFGRGYEKWQRHGGDSCSEGDGGGPKIVVCDAKLLSLALAQLSDCLEGMILGGMAAVGADGLRSAIAAVTAASSPAPLPPTIPENIVAAYQLDDPLHISAKSARLSRVRAATATSSSAGGAGSGSSGSNDPTFSSYGGAFLPLERNANAGDSDGAIQAIQNASSFSSRRSGPAEVLSLFIRAQITATGGGHGAAMASLMKSLLGIVRVCYEFRPGTHSPQGAGNDGEPSARHPTASSALIGKKKGAKKKKRKVGEFATSTLAVSASNIDGIRPRKTLTRCVLSSDTLNVLIKLLSHDIARIASSSTGIDPSSSLCIRSHFRQCLPIESVLNFVGLGHMLDGKLVRPRLEFVKGEFSALSLRDDTASSMHTLENPFDPWERRLWTSHVRFALTIGKGRTATAAPGGRGPPRMSRSYGDVPVLPCLDGSPARLQVFQAIIATEDQREWSIGGAKQQQRRQEQLARRGKKLRTATKDSADDSETRLWPLCLSAVQHALVSSLVLSDEPPSSDRMMSDLSYVEDLSSQAELLFLCNSFLNSIEEVLSDMPRVPSSKCGEKAELSITDNDDVPISLRDARLFVLAVARLGQHADRRDMVSRCIGILHEGLLQQRGATEEETFQTIGSASSHFLARVITLCASLVDVALSPSLSSSLSVELKSTNYGIPRPRRIRTTPSEQSGSSQQFHFSKEVFQGLLADWQSPSAPATNISSTEIMEENNYRKFQAVLQSGLDLGLRTSSRDDCHLLFSSWNTAMKLSSWSSLSWEGPASVLAVKKLSPVERMVRLREDMCEVHDLMQRKSARSRPSPEMLLTKVVQNKISLCRPSEALLSGLNSAEKMLAFLALEITSFNPTTTLANFAYYEALPLYVSFLISMHTRPGTNDMGSMHRLAAQNNPHSSSRQAKQKRLAAGYENSSEDSDLETDDAGTSAVRANALTRLHEACLAVGAAPCYPDWLDMGCSMREDITPPVAADSSGRALKSLTQFGVAAFQCYFQAIQQAFVVLREGPMPEEEITAASPVALQLFFAQQQLLSNISESFCARVSALCGFGDGSILKILLDAISSQYSLAGGALVSTSAQRIKGANVSRTWKVVPGEHRANCQWEILLSESLQGSSLSMPSATTINAAGNDSGAMNGISDALVSVNHWRRVLYSVVNAMVPTAALLRFGISNGKGRNTHTLCEDRIPGSVFSNSDNQVAVSSPSSCFFTNNEVETTLKNALSFLSCLSACSPNDEDMRLVARAAADHLLENSAHLNDLISMWAARISFEAIDGVVQTLADENLTEYQRTSACTIIETSLTQFGDSSGDHFDETGQPVMTLDGSFEHEKRTTLLACLGMRNLKVGKLIGNRSDLELTDILTNFGLFLRNEGWGPMRRDTTKLLLTLMCVGKVQLHIRARIFVAEMLIDLMGAEFEILKGGKSGYCEIVCLSAAVSLDNLSKDDVLLLVENLCYSSTAVEGSFQEEKKLLSDKTARVISHIASVTCKGVSGDGCKIILHEMLERLNQWAGSPQHHVVKLLCLLASRFGALDEVGRKIVLLLRPEYVGTTKIFFEFVARLHHLVHKKATEPTKVEKSFPTRTSRKLTSQGACTMLRTGEEVSRTCSFVETGEGFTEQHWYNCYTCGLLWDKGCCSLCARVCHKGHDVGYSRKSSFFCDCGAEVATALEQNRSPCKCLSPVCEGTIRDLYELEPQVDDPETMQAAHNDSDTFTELVAKNFPSQCKASLRKLMEEAKTLKWSESILLIFNQCYQMAPSPGGFDFSSLFSNTGPQAIAGGSIKLRSAVPLELKRLYETSMVPIRATKASALQSRMVSSSSSSHTRKAKNDLAVQAIAADNRGRLFISESSSVLFCNAIPSVNTRFMENSPASHLTRAQLNILGFDSTKFPINGMAICPENNRHLLLWGVSKASVAIVSKAFDSFERVIELKLNLDSSECESEYLVKCDWMPQSELQIVAVCGTVVHAFDLKRTENNCCNATTHYALAYEDVLIRSATLIGSLSVDDGATIESKLALLLDTGRLYFISLTIDEEGNLEDHGESYIEIGSGVSFPSAGIRRYCGTECSSGDSTATTFGEGSYLAYLRQSNLLLYQCVSSCIVALLLDDEGAICGSFELLPNMISADHIGGHYGVAGPYTHFQELGTVRRGAETLYRVSCIGRSTRSTQPRVLVLEFNEHSVSVKELSWPTNCSAGLGFISSYNFIGSCTFSVPFLLGGNAKEGFIKNETVVYERAMLTLLSSSGGLVFYGEDCEHLIPKNLRTQDMSPSSNHYQPPEIGIFEKLINISEVDGLVFGGDFVGKDPKAIKKKLSLNNNDYVISPSRDGCTLTLGLQVNSCQVEENALTIVAVRVLVGSMPDLIPREIAIMGSGRSMKLKKNVKRWYDFPLTDEETLLAMRNGFVTVWISPCHEPSSTPIIDSVEVYARARADLPFLTPDLVDGGGRDEDLSKLTRIQELPLSEILVSCIQSLTFLTQIIGQNEMGSLSATSKGTISHILQQTALDSDESGTLRDQTIEFLSEAMSGDLVNRSYLIDEATLRGLMSTLQGIGEFLRTYFANVDIVSPKQEALINCSIEILLRILTSTISVARMRGGNYRKIMTAMIAEKSCQVSMALESKKILDFCHYLKALHGANLRLAQPAQLVSELILMEMACSDSKDFAHFDTISEYLLVDSTEIVKACCSAISSAIEGVEGSKISINSSSPEKDLAYVTYQCDACLVFPITERRYTLGGDEMDIDLCKQCYDLGIAYARTHDQNDPVIINARTLCVENEDMTCGKIWQMTSKPIAASSLEQAENAKKAGLLNPAKDAVLKLSSGSTNVQSVDTSNCKQRDGIEVVKTEGFKSQIFTQLLGLLSKSLDATKKEETSPPSNYVLQLVINLVLDSCTEELRCARGKEMAFAFTKNIPGLVNACQSNESSFSQNSRKLVVSMRALASLVLQKRGISCAPALVASSEEDKDSAQTQHNLPATVATSEKDKTDPRFVCEVHGVPAVRRRCSHGPHKDRRFYVCGLERKHRCNYFKWSSDIPDFASDESGKPQHKNQISGRDDAHDIFVPVQKELQNIFSEKELQDQCCSLVRNQFEKNQVISTVPEVSLVNEGRTAEVVLPSLKTDRELQQDMEDGVYRTLDKFGKSKPVPSQPKDDDSLPSSAVTDGSKDSFLCASLDLFSLLAPKLKTTSAMSDSPGWSSEWFSVLCEIISTSPSHLLRHLAKSMLQRLCGGRQEIYHRVRDHYVFGFQFRKLLQRSQCILDSALVVREQARQCGPDWREDEVMFETLPASGLLGVEELISEDCYGISTEESIATVLDELLSAAGRGVGATTKVRSNNWRQFCGLPEMAISSRKGNPASIEESVLEMLEQMYHRPPIVSLLWLSSCLRGSNQVKALSLTDIALEDPNASTSTVRLAYENAQHDDVNEDDILVGGYKTSDSCSSDPEQCLLKCFTVDDLIAFIKQFVLNGRSRDLRLVSSSVARKLALQFPSSDKNRLFTSLIDGPFQELGTLGNASSNFSDLLRLFVECFGSELDLSSVSSHIATSFLNQMIHLNHHCGQNQRLLIKSEADSGGFNCDLSDCVHCHKQNIQQKRASKSSSKKESDACKPAFLPDQVRPYQRGRLETSTATTVSSEFSSYNQLKFRVALSQVHVNVSDPRGRLVKTIGVYFSPRQVSDANVLKTAKYAHLWQRCGTLSLARGASEATCKLKTPVIAANLKFTYEEFYEKSSNKRAPDGSFILYCPRCTRQVHNAHGVCGNCGEVAFQCRKCRHINYDRLDAFLCVECGYCTAGGFTYELTAGIALNAIAILDEDGFQRNMAMLQIATKRQSDLRNNLKKKVMVAMQQQRKLRDQNENLDEMVLYGPHLKRALLGGMPKTDGFDEDNDSSKKPSGSSRSSYSLSERASSTSSRARSSLLSLARSLRTESGESLGTRGDFLRQALLSVGGSGPSGFDPLDDADLISALASGAASSSGDPLSRIVASIQARARDEVRSSQAAASGAADSGGAGRAKSDTPKASPSEERHRLHTQMREAERECYELNRRIDAWNRLNKDCLAGFRRRTHFTAKPFNFLPSTCSACSPQLTYQILSLLYAVYTADILQSEHTVTSDIIKVLLKESEYLSPRLKELKRRVIITLASTSEVASKIILAELKSRLIAVQDVTSAEILGKLVQLDFELVEDYIDLAIATLENMY